MTLRLSAFIIAGLPLAASLLAQTGSGLSTLSISSAEHAYYISASQHIEQIYSTGGSWTSQDLTSLSGTTALASRGTPVTALLISTTDHVYYVDTNQHIDQLYFNGSSWVNQDLTALAPSSPAVALGTGLSSLYIGADHIYFIDQSNQHINQIYFNGSGWVYQDLTVAAGTSTTAQHGSALTSLYIGADHVYYTDTAGHVNQIYFNGSGWTNQDLTSLAGTSAVASARSPLTSLYISTDHVYYVDSNQKVNQLYFNGSGWTNQNISTASGTSAVANLRSGITSLYFSSADHIYYVDGSQHLDELSWTGTAWLNQDLTSASGTSAIAQIDEGLGSLETSSGDHVFYVDTAAHVDLMEYSGPSRITWT